MKPIQFQLLDTNMDLYEQAKTIKDPKRKGLKNDNICHRDLFILGCEKWVEINNK